jgi:hypothetical protein
MKTGITKVLSLRRQHLKTTSLLLAWNFQKKLAAKAESASPPETFPMAHR